MRRTLFFGFVSVSSYFTGILFYICLFLFIYQQNIVHEIGKLITWTAPSYIFIVIACYLGIDMVLKIKNVPSFFIRTVIFILVGIIPTYIAAVMMGFRFFVDISYFVSSEALPFYVFFTGTALLFSYGCHVAHKKHGVKIYSAISILVIVVTLGVLNQSVN